MDNENNNQDIEIVEEQSPTIIKHKHKSTKAEIEVRILEVFSQLMSGLSKKETSSLIKRKYNLSDKAFKRLYDGALILIREEMEAPIENIRAEYLTGLRNDLRTAFKNYEKYDRQDNPKHNTLALQWFMTYLKIKDAINEYYPGIKPTQTIDDRPSIVFLADDGDASTDEEIVQMVSESEEDWEWEDE